MGGIGSQAIKPMRTARKLLGRVRVWRALVHGNKSNMISLQCLSDRSHTPDLSASDAVTNGEERDEPEPSLGLQSHRVRGSPRLLLAISHRQLPGPIGKHQLDSADWN
jgi:hypothetical protein